MRAISLVTSKEPSGAESLVYSDSADEAGLDQTPLGLQFSHILPALRLHESGRASRLLS